MKERPRIIPETIGRNCSDLAREIEGAQSLASKLDTADADPGEVQCLIDAVDRIESEWRNHFSQDLEALITNAERITEALYDLMDAAQEMDT